MPDLRDRTSPAGETGQVPDETTGCVQDNPPADIAAERACAGALLLAAVDVARSALDRLRDEDFTDPRCRFVASVERQMLAGGVSPDPVTFASYVERRGLLEPGPSRTFLRSWLAELIAAAPVPANLSFYADAVILAAVRRRGVDDTARLGRLFIGADATDLPEAVKSTLLGLLDALDRCVVPAGAVTADV